mgnify:CR=1 FL=1
MLLGSRIQMGESKFITAINVGAVLGRFSKKVRVPAPSECDTPSKSPAVDNAKKKMRPRASRAAFAQLPLQFASKLLLNRRTHAFAEQANELVAQCGVFRVSRIFPNFRTLVQQVGSSHRTAARVHQSIKTDHA